MEEEKSNVQEEKKDEENKIEKEDIEKEHSKKKEKICDKENLTDKMRENPWIVSTLVLGILGLILLVGNLSGGMSGNIISESEAGEAILDLAKLQIEDAELIEVNSKNGLYEIILSTEGREIPVYLTMDGENLVQGVTPLAILMGQAQQQTQTTEEVSEYSAEDLEKLREFSSCLAEKELIIYGANWCGWTKRLAVQTLGGFDIMGDAYVECTEEEELCSQEGITGYPTIKLNGEPYQGERTLESLAEATGCSAPDVETQIASTNEEASCS